MCRFAWGVCGGLLAALMPTLLPTSALAQTPQSPFAGGTAVGKPLLANVGQTLPKVAPNVGSAIGYKGPDGNPVNTQKPPGKVIDLKNLAAPLTAPLGPGLDDTPKSIFEKVYDKWRAAIGLSKPTSGPSPNYTPGLSRRNRERRTAMWRWD